MLPTLLKNVNEKMLVTLPKNVDEKKCWQTFEKMLATLQKILTKKCW
jgi:hypothetical protein